jgi:hypothetical protein
MRLAITLAALCALAVGSCNQADKPDPNICLSPPSAATLKAEETNEPGDSPQIKAGRAQTAAENCVHRAAYNMAGARDGASTVADAVVTACQQAIDGALYASLAVGAGAQSEAQLHNDMHALALFRVVQARAGHCAKPPYLPISN